MYYAMHYLEYSTIIIILCLIIKYVAIVNYSDISVMAICNFIQLCLHYFRYYKNIV